MVDKNKSEPQNHFYNFWYYYIQNLYFMFICEPIQDIKGISTQILPHKYLDDIHITGIKQKSFYKTNIFKIFSWNWLYNVCLIQCSDLRSSHRLSSCSGGRLWCSRLVQLWRFRLLEESTPLLSNQLWIKLNQDITHAGNAVIIVKRMFKPSTSFNITGVGSPTAVP